MAASASNLFGAVTKGEAGDLGDLIGDLFGKADRALRPVPTAVPPWASACRPGSVSSMRLIAEATCAA
jgi:hypothetical protein